MLAWCLVAPMEKFITAQHGDIEPPSEREVGFAKQKTEGECGIKK